MVSKLKKGEGMERRRGNCIFELGRQVSSMARILLFWRFLCVPGPIEGLECPPPWTEKWSGLWSMRTGVRTAKGPEAVSSPEALSWV